MIARVVDIVAYFVVKSQKCNFFLGRGHAPSPTGEGDTPSQAPPPRRLRRLASSLPMDGPPSLSIPAAAPD